MVGLSYNINIMGKVISTSNLGNVGRELTAAFRGNSVAMYFYCILINKTGK